MPLKIARFGTIALIAMWWQCAPAMGDWPTLRGNNQRTGYVNTAIRPPFRVSWVRHFVGERMGSAVEPIVARGNVFLTTHSGNIYALGAEDGKPLWRYSSSGDAFLHSPAVHNSMLVAGDAGGVLHAVDTSTGKSRWRARVGSGGFACSPTVEGSLVYAGTRGGEFVAVRAANGTIAWRTKLPAPIRQTAATHGGRVFIAAEDMRLRALEATTGKVLWQSQPLPGQSCRDYYPVIAQVGSRAYVVLRTSPSHNMSHRIHQDLQLLCQNSGIASDWRAIEAWLNRTDRVETPDNLMREQRAILEYLRRNPDARTFFAMDAQTGKPAASAPVLWAAGCQGVAAPPVPLPDGRLFTLYRSAYGNWTLGVAPLIALGLLNLEQGSIELLRHKHGPQPPWDTFWGTADESQNCVVAGDTAILVHQSTLTAFDWRQGNLHRIAGTRDGWGGFRNLPWARNEWNGPARGGVAVAGNRLYWQTGSRVLCIVSGSDGERAADQETVGSSIPGSSTPAAERVTAVELRDKLSRAVGDAVAQTWMPLCLEPGIGGRWHVFDSSGEVVEALSTAFPHLSQELQKKVKVHLAALWQRHPPFTAQAWLPLDSGTPREWAEVPDSIRRQERTEPLPHPFGNMHAVWLYAERCQEWQRIQQAWPQIRACFEEFVARKWSLNSERGDPFANRYLASLHAFERMAKRWQDSSMAALARQMIDHTEAQLVEWWRTSGDSASLPVIPGIAEWDGFLQHGDALFHMLRPHRAVVAHFQDLTPEIAALLRERVPQPVRKLWKTFHALCPTWHVVGEERQVHTGENLSDPPGFALGAYRAMLWLNDPTPQEIARRVDIPFCRADLSYILKLGLALDSLQRIQLRRGR